MHKLLKIDLSKVLFTQKELESDVIWVSKLDNVKWRCGYESATVYTQDGAKIWSTCALMLGESVIIDLSAKKSMLNANLKTIRRFLHEGTMYCEFSKNFIPESKYTRIYNEYLTVFNDYSMHVAHSLKITNQGENLSIPEFELLFAKSDDLLKQIKSSKYHRELDLEIRRIHINMLEELTQNQSQTVEIVSTFYPKHEYEVLKSKLEWNDKPELKSKPNSAKKHKSYSKTKSKRKYYNAKGKRHKKYEAKYAKQSDYQTDWDSKKLVKKPISIQLPDNRSISLLADPFEKVYCLKHRIEELESIPISSQRLTYHFKELADENLITTYNIKSNALLKLSLKSVSCTPTIVIHSDEGVKYTLKIDLNDTIKEIKLKLNTIFGAEITDKNIVLNGKVLNDRMTLFGYEIKPNDVLYLEDSKIMVYVQVGGGEIQAIPLKIDTTVVELKQNILQDDLSTKQAKLFFNGAELKCNYKTLKQYGIKHNSKLYLF